MQEKRLKFDIALNKDKIEVKIYRIEKENWKEVKPKFKIFDTYNHDFAEVINGAVLSAHPKMSIRCVPIKYNRVIVGVQTKHKFTAVAEFDTIYPLSPNREELKNLLALLTGLKNKAKEIKKR